MSSPHSANDVLPGKTADSRTLYVPIHKRGVSSPSKVLPSGSYKGRLDEVASAARRRKSRPADIVVPSSNTRPTSIPYTIFPASHEHNPSAMLSPNWRSATANRSTPATPTRKERVPRVYSIQELLELSQSPLVHYALSPSALGEVVDSGAYYTSHEASTPITQERPQSGLDHRQLQCQPDPIGAERDALAAAVNEELAKFYVNMVRLEAGIHGGGGMQPLPIAGFSPTRASNVPSGFTTATVGIPAMPWMQMQSQPHLYHLYANSNFVGGNMINNQRTLPYAYKAEGDNILYDSAASLSGIGLGSYGIPNGRMSQVQAQPTYPRVQSLNQWPTAEPSNQVLNHDLFQQLKTLRAHIERSYRSLSMDPQAHIPQGLPNHGKGNGNNTLYDNTLYDRRSEDGAMSWRKGGQGRDATFGM